MFLILYTQSLQKSMQEHFAAYGSVTDISFQIDETDESKSLFALVTFASRSDAEKVGCLYEVRYLPNIHHGILNIFSLLDS